MDIQEKTKLGLRILKYFKGIGCEIQLIDRDRDTYSAPSLFVYRLTGDWTRKFQHKVELFKYVSDRYEITHEKFLAAFIEWYCSPRVVQSFRHFEIESNSNIHMPVANSPEELSLQIAIYGY